MKRITMILNERYPRDRCNDVYGCSVRDSLMYGTTGVVDGDLVSTAFL